MSTSSSSKSSVSEVFGRHAQVLAEPGEIWLSAKKYEVPWPVVICDEEMLQTLSKGGERPVNAQKANGQWRKEVLPGGVLEGSVVFPTMRLGTMKFCWTPWRRLQAIDIQKAILNRDYNADKELSAAYVEAIEQYGRINLSYWKGKLFAKCPDVDGASIKVKITKKTDVSPLKRRISAMGFVYPPVIDLPAELEDDTKDEKKESLLLKDNGNPIRDRKKESPKRMKRNGGTAISPPPQNRRSASDSSTSEPTENTEEGQSLQGLVQSTPNMGVTLYVGNPHKTFLVRRDRLWLSEVLEDNVSQDAEIGPYVMLPLLLGIDADDFELVVLGYLTHWRLPRFGDPINLAKAYEIGRKLAMEQLVHGCWRRFSLCLSATTNEVLKGIGIVLGGGIKDEDMRHALISHLATHFWDYMRLDTKKLQAVLRSDVDIAKTVLEEFALLKWF